LVGGFVLNKWFWLVVVVADEGRDGILQFLGGAMRAAPQNRRFRANSRLIVEALCFKAAIAAGCLTGK
jgi:hypothetical protein